MRKLLLIASLLCSQSVVNCTGSRAQDQALIHFASHLQGAVISLDENKLFHVIHEDVAIEVQNCFVDPMIRNCTQKYLVSFLSNSGYLIVNQFEDGEFYIKAKMRLNGGGWFTDLLKGFFKEPEPAFNDGPDYSQYIDADDYRINLIISKDSFTTKCVVGPGIPIGPIAFPAPTLPMQRIVLPQPRPRLPGETFHA